MGVRSSRTDAREAPTMPREMQGIESNTLIGKYNIFCRESAAQQGMGEKYPTMPTDMQGMSSPLRPIGKTSGFHRNMVKE